MAIAACCWACASRRSVSGRVFRGFRLWDSEVKGLEVQSAVQVLNPLYVLSCARLLRTDE